jgi:hypothetical protein
MHAAAVSPQQVQLGTHRAALRMWIPEDTKCMVWHFRTPFKLAQSRADWESARVLNS